MAGRDGDIGSLYCFAGGQRHAIGRIRRPAPSHDEIRVFICYDVHFWSAAAISPADRARTRELRFAVILEKSTLAKASGAVFQAPDGRGFVFSAASIEPQPIASAADLVLMPACSRYSLDGVCPTKSGLHET